MSARGRDAVFTQAAELALHERQANRGRSSAWGSGDPEQDAALRAATAVLAAAPELRLQPGYADLLGPPTVRERLVAFVRGLRPETGNWRPAMQFAVAGLVLLAGSVWFLQRDTAGEAYDTEVAEVRGLTLADGSEVTLGADSALRIAFDDEDRRVVLEGGEAFFEVTHNSARPFVVIAGDTEVTVTGTRFEVKRAGDQVRVAVAEGSVRVASLAKPGAVVVRLGAGEQAISSGEAQTPRREEAPAIEPGAWRVGRMMYQDAPLSEIVADANRYRAAPIRIGSPALAEVRLTTSFRTAQIDAMLATLPETAPLTVRHRADGSVDLLPR